LVEHHGDAGSEPDGGDHLGLGGLGHWGRRSRVRLIGPEARPGGRRLTGRRRRVLDLDRTAPVRWERRERLGESRDGLQGFVGRPGQFGLDLGEGLALRLAPLDGYKLQ
jgi:hypothetical protein